MMISIFKKRTEEEETMGCRDYQKLFKDFISRKLPFKERLAFVKHMRGCDECMEELRAYYMFYSTARYLSPNESIEMPQSVEAYLKETENEALYLKKRNRNLAVAVVAFGLGILILTLMVLQESLF